MNEQIPGYDNTAFAELTDKLGDEMPLARFERARGELHDFLTESFAEKSAPPTNG